MDRKRTDVEFDGVIDEQGKIALPPEALQHFENGKPIHVRLSSRQISSALRVKNVTEEEMERIEAQQLEPREQVVQFLLSEGALRRNQRFQARAQRLWKGRSD